MTTSRARAALLILPLTLGLAACSGAADGSETTGSGGPIAVTASDTACEVARTEAPAGTVEFAVTNSGTKVNEFYVYAEGDRIMGEVENIGPGLSRTFHVELAEPGTYQTACKPGMVGDGIRADFTVTGSSAAAKSDDEKLTAATTDYQRYVSSQADEFLEETTEFVGLVKAGKVEEAKALYPTARSYWERIEPVAESFGDLDPKIDGREDVVEEGMEFTGYHRLEKDLWETGLRSDSGAIADRLLADVTELVAKAKAVELNPLQLANGSKALLDEIATGKITGEEERYSHTDLWDFEANFEGSKAAIQALRPFLREADPDLVATIDSRGTALGDLLETHRDGDGFVLYTELTPADVKKLTEALDAFAEPVATVAGAVAKG
ncbi:iron uptake system protein EfeO [Phycicoccus sonneratiae]|uniref:Cupredoxin domain-containing protein n=1 Tax=Phycicoccus sonneratiae TaxID=2807628 RepID=A0ABS2CPB4_9MICO|nr:iron uptake system protein EfeO [Phycicoccus sonneraticus]MBM6401716.1 cupredoxin domain-containing protein [Phycicoccus sonneraticus]